MTRTITYIIEELKDPGAVKSDINYPDQKYCVCSYFEDPTQSVLKEGNYIPVSISSINKEEKGIKVKYSKFIFDIKEIEESLMEKYQVNQDILVKVEAIGDDLNLTLKIEEVDTCHIKNIKVRDSLKEYFNFDESEDLYQFSCKPEEKKNGQWEINPCVDVYNISENKFLHDTEMEVKKKVESMPIGGYKFHSSDEDPKKLLTTWKLYDQWVYTHPIEERKSNASGSENMFVDGMYFNYEKEFALNYGGRQAQLLLDVYNDKHFKILESISEMKEYLKYKRATERYELSYGYTILSQYHKNICLGYLRETGRFVLEFIEIINEGYFSITNSSQISLEWKVGSSLTTTILSTLDI